MGTLGVDYAFVYPDSEPNTDVSDLNTSRELVNRQSQLFMLGTTLIPIADPEMVDKLERLIGAGEIIGIKLYPGFELFYPSDARCHPVYELCVKHNIPVVFHAGETMGQAWREAYNHPHAIVKVAEQFPELKIVIAHFAQPHLKACQEILSSSPNVYADISGLAHPEVEELCGKEVIADTLTEVARTQPGKVLFGTDWPICDVEQHIQLVMSLPVSDQTKELILSGNAVEVFGLSLD
jgi:predicted TIM-barrel fold metal-dependent hydrolase